MTDKYKTYTKAELGMHWDATKEDLEEKTRHVETLEIDIESQDFRMKADKKMLVKFQMENVLLREKIRLLKDTVVRLALSETESLND